MARSADARPNILLIHCHDLGRFLGSYDVPTVQTPNLDELANDGVRFDRAFCTAPQCSPSRASLFTGRYPHSNGVMGLTHGHFAWNLHDGERHLAGELKAAGFATSLVGVHHESLASPPEVVAERLGFDDVVLQGLADTVADRSVERLERFAGSGQPFYLQTGFYEPHRLRGSNDKPDVLGFLGDDMTADEELGVTVPPYLEDTEGSRLEVAEIQGAVRKMDAATGRILRRLRELDLEQDTIVLFTTDHGLALPRAKCSLYDPGLEVALLVRYPARGWTGGRTTDGLVSNVDVVPTLLETVGLPTPEQVQGQSLRRFLDGDGDVERTEIFGEMTYHDYYDPRRCIRTERHKLIVNFTSAPDFMDPSQSWRPRSTARAPHAGQGAYHKPVELYDLHDDPVELANLAEDPAHAETRRDLLAKLWAWMAETKDPLLEGAVTSPLHRRAVQELSNAVS